MRVAALIYWKLNIWQFPVQNRRMIIFSTQMKTGLEWTFLEFHFLFLCLLSFYQHFFSFEILYPLFIQSNMDLRDIPALCEFFWFGVDFWSESELILISFIITKKKSLFINIRIIKKIDYCFSELIVIKLCIKLIHLLEDRF